MEKKMTNKKYQLHQIHLTDEEFNKVNAEGHNSVEKNVFKISSFCCSFTYFLFKLI